MERSVSGLLHTTDTAKQENKVKEIDFLENPKLSTLYQWNFDDFKQDIFKKDANKDQLGNAGDSCACDVDVIDRLMKENAPDPDFVYRKEFLDLTFNQTEDQSSLEYKKKMLAKKLMKDKTFSLNKVFEFTFEDKVKNFIAASLVKEPKLDRVTMEELNIFKMQEKDFDNEFIINLCQGRFGLEDIYGPRIKKKESIKTDVGMENNGDFEIDEGAEFLINDEPYEICEVMGEEFTFNFEEDEKLDMVTLNFFRNYIKTHDNTTIAAKIELMLNKILAKSEKTGKDIFTNKMKNERLRYWKAEYDARARELNIQSINERLQNIKNRGLQMSLKPRTPLKPKPLKMFNSRNAKTAKAGESPSKGNTTTRSNALSTKTSVGKQFNKGKTPLKGKAKKT